MRRLLLLAAVASLLSTPAFANTGSDKMKACAAQWRAMSAADKAATNYRDYTATCMKGGLLNVKSTPQQRMKSCAAKWDAMKTSGKTGGQSYRQFTSACLSGQPTPM